MYSIQFSEVHYATVPESALLNGVSFALNRGIYALAGRNGAGKSTILRLIAGELVPDRGTVSAARGQLAYLAQSIPHAAENSKSSGENKMIALAKLFRFTQGTLLIDEPETHLDRYNRTWLLKKLHRHQGIVLLVSHDEHLLNAADTILHLHQGKVQTYAMPYADFRRELARATTETEYALRRHELRLKREHQHAVLAVERQQKRSDNAARKAPFAGIPRVARGLMKRNAEKTLGKIISHARENLAASTEKLAVFRTAHGYYSDFAFSASAAQTTPVNLEVSNLQLWKSQTSALWLKPVSFALRNGDKLLLEGRNGTGKSQLLAAIADEAVFAVTGEVRRSAHGFCLLSGQHGDIAGNASVLGFAKLVASERPEGEIRRLLGAFGYRGEKVFQRFHSLSAGEKIRLRLFALTRLIEFNGILLLDEVETGLDTETKSLLAKYIQDFPGVAVVASHDESFVRELASAQTLALQRE